METCDSDEKNDEITKHFTEEIRKIKIELKASKETIQLNTAQLEKVNTELESSKTSLDQLQRENAWLKENPEKTSKNQDIIMSKIESLSQSSSQEAIYFDYSLGSSMTSTGREIVKFDRPRAVSPTKIYDASTGIVTIEEEGLYYFYAHGFPYDEYGDFILEIYVDDELACTAYKGYGLTHMSCAIVRHLKRGQQIHVKKSKKLIGDIYCTTGFLGFKLQ